MSRPHGTIKPENEPIYDELRRRELAGSKESLNLVAKRLGVSRNRVYGIAWRMGMFKSSERRARRRERHSLPEPKDIREPSRPRTITEV